MPKKSKAQASSNDAKNWSIENVPIDLRKRAKRAALDSDTTLRKWVMNLITAALDAGWKPGKRIGVTDSEK